MELARDAIRGYILNGSREQPGSMREAFYARSAAFVRIETAAPRGQLRGSAAAYDAPSEIEGASRHLGTAIVDAAIAAASGNSRSPLTGPELDNVLVTVFVVEAVEDVTGPEEVRVGRDGVAVEGRGTAGWMFPTVPVDHGWGAVEYVERTCRKAGLAPDAWRDDDVRAVRLVGPVYGEISPGGAVDLLFE